MHVYTNYYKKKKIMIIYKIYPTNIKKISLVNIRMINLSFDELRLIVQIRNISDYENKSKGDLIKALSEPKPEPQIPKPETPKTRIKTNKRKLRKLRKDFDELRHKFSKKSEI